VNKHPTDATVCRYLFTAKLLYVFRVSQHPSSGVSNTVNAASGTGHTTCTASPLQRGLIGTGLCELTRLAQTTTLHVSGVTAPIVRSIEYCNSSLRYRSYYLYRYSPPTWSDRDLFVRLDSHKQVPIRPRWRGVAVQVV